MKNKPSLYLFLSSLIFTCACQKEAPFNPGGGGNTNVSSCQLVTDSSDQTFILGNKFTLTYDGNGKLTSVVAYSAETQAATIAVTGQEIVRKAGGTTETFDFTKNIFTGSPDSYTYANSADPLSNKKVMLSYSGGLVTRTQEFDGSGNPGRVVSLSYSDSKDLTTIAITNGGSTTTYVSTGYDDKNNPYSGLAGSNLLFYSWDYSNVASTDLFTKLSRHNILGWKLKYGTDSTVAGYSYTYNEKNLPASVTVSTQSSSGGTPGAIYYSEYAYTYDCK